MNPEFKAYWATCAFAFVLCFLIGLTKGATLLIFLQIFVFAVGAFTLFVFTIIALERYLSNCWDD